MGGIVMSGKVSRDPGDLFYVGDRNYPIFGFVIDWPEALFVNMDPWREQGNHVSMGTVPMEGATFLDREGLAKLIEGSLFNDIGDDRFILMIAEIVRMMAMRTGRLLKK